MVTLFFMDQWPSARMLLVIGYWVIGSGSWVIVEQRTAEYRISNRRMSKDGIASLYHFEIDRIHSFDIRYSLFDILFSYLSNFSSSQLPSLPLCSMHYAQSSLLITQSWGVSSLRHSLFPPSAFRLPSSLLPTILPSPSAFPFPNSDQPSHLLTFPPSHLPIFSPSHLLTFPSSHLPTFSPSHLLIF